MPVDPQDDSLLTCATTSVRRYLREEGLTFLGIIAQVRPSCGDEPTEIDSRIAYLHNQTPFPKTVYLAQLLSMLMDAFPETVVQKVIETYYEKLEEKKNASPSLRVVRDPPLPN